MRKLYLFIFLLTLATEAIGSRFFSQSAAFWLTSGSELYQYVRLVLAAILTVQLLTHPPRNPLFRLLAGVVGLAVGYWAVVQTYNYTMQLNDTFSFLAAGIAVFTTAAEKPFTEIPASLVAAIRVNLLQDAKTRRRRRSVRATA